MEKIILSICCALAAATTTIKSGDPEDYEEEFTVPFNGQKFDAFDWQLCTEVANTNNGNILISPISVKFLLNMLYEGSSGDTAKELEKKLQLPEDKTLARMKSSAVLRSLQTTSPKYTLEIGTKIFVDESMTPKNWFQRILFLYYNAYIEKMSFKDPKKSLKRINYWVESVTHGHIKDFIDQGNLNEASILLVNAIYFKGTWKSSFPPENTFLGNFESYEGPTKVQYMKQISSYYYTRSQETNAQILRLPYEGQKYAMYVILPEEKDGLERLIKTVSPNTLRKSIWQMEETSVEVILPKFKFDCKTDFKPILRRFGLNKIFDSFGEMKGLTQSDKGANLIVSNVIQKAGIEVNEEGSVAAAASEMQLINKIGIQDELFNASHPFLFFIEDESTGTVVFVGKFVKPPEDNVSEMEMVDTTPTITTITAKTSTTAIPDAKKETSTAKNAAALGRQNNPTADGHYRKINSTMALSRQNNAPKLYELKQKRIKAEMSRSSSLQALGGIKNGDRENSNRINY